MWDSFLKSLFPFLLGLLFSFPLFLVVRSFLVPIVMLASFSMAGCVHQVGSGGGVSQIQGIGGPFLGWGGWEFVPFVLLPFFLLVVAIRILASIGSVADRLVVSRLSRPSPCRPVRDRHLPCERQNSRR